MLGPAARLCLAAARRKEQFAGCTTSHSAFPSSMLQINLLVLQPLPFPGEPVDMDPRCWGLLLMSCCCQLVNISC